jgi:hypothetical protein
MSPEVPVSLAEQLAILEEARGATQRGTIHDLPPPATAILANEGEYTTTHKRPPAEKFGRFHEVMRTERALGRLATNACVALQDIEELQDAGKHMG